MNVDANSSIYEPLRFSISHKIYCFSFRELNGIFCSPDRDDIT